MKKFFLALELIALLFIFASCQSTKNQSALRPVYITNSKKITLLEPQYANSNIDGILLLTGKFNDTSFSMMSYSQIDNKQISLSLFNDFGTDMGSLFYDGQKVLFESAYLPSKLPGEYIIADIQNAFYDFEALKENFALVKLVFEESEDKTVRRIFDGKKLIEEIINTESQITVTNYLRGYQYNLYFSD